MPLNSGAQTFISYRTGSQTVPALAACSIDLATRAHWTRGNDLGSEYLPMVVELRGSEPPRRKGKTRWDHHKADWMGFGVPCEAVLSVPAPPQATVQQLATRFTSVVRGLSPGEREETPRRVPSTRTSICRPVRPCPPPGESAEDRPRCVTSTRRQEIPSLRQLSRHPQVAARRTPGRS